MATAKTPAKVALKATAQAAADATKPSVKLAAPAAKRAAGKPAKAEKADKAEKAKKPKMVRDSFTIPKTEYGVLDALKARAAKAGVPAKKSEVLRAGIKALAAMTDGAFLASLGAVPAIKTGRPPKA